MQFLLLALVFAAGVVAQPLVDADVLEPSVQNEVEHAVAKAPRCPATQTAGAGTRLVNGTNGMSRTDIAIRLVSEQKPDGRWYVGTNDVTAVAVEILKAL